MTVDLEAAGALVTAGLVASEIESGKGADAKDTHIAQKCVNCGAALAGRYCQACGQSAHLHRSLWHIAEEALHGVFHFDTKSWRTLPLLVARPGLLTRRYIDGQRVRYVSPLALFLFTVFLMFFVVSLVSTDSNINIGQATDRNKIRTDLNTAVARAKAKIVEQEAALKGADTDDDRKDAAAALAELQLTQDVAEKALTSISSIADKEGKVTAAASDRPKKKRNNFNFNIGPGDSKLSETVRHNLENQDLLLYKLKNTAYKYSFMLIPISLPFLWLMFFWRPNVRLYDHAVFSLYSLSFMSLFFVMIALLTTKPYLKNYIGAMFFLPPVHMFLQLRETYGLRFFSAFWRTLALLFVAGAVFVLFLTMILALSVT